ncbi:MAG TPA: RNA polymerase factor sigma-54 [Bryobacterales bacterium]|nr:RNA polymerase factor sigma-54 [Bryobacterales bacterium]
MLVQPKLSLRLAQKQILTPGLVQMVTVLALNKLELKEMINQELVENPVLEEAAEDETSAAEDRTPEELDLEDERVTDPADQQILDAAGTDAAAELRAESAAEMEAPLEMTSLDGLASAALRESPAEAPAEAEPAKDALESKDPFDEIDFGSFFDEYLDPGYKSPASEVIERPSFETFLATPTSLSDHLNWQLSLANATEPVAQAADLIIGNLSDDGYLTIALEEVAEGAKVSLEDAQAALKLVQEFDPLGVAARDLRECLLIQLRSLGAEGGVAWQIVSDHIALIENRDTKSLAKALGRPQAHIEKALEVIKKLNPRPGQRYSTEGARLIEPDVAFVKVDEDYQVVMNDDDLPQLRLNRQYRGLLERDGGSTKEVRNYVKERWSSAIQLMRNIEQRKQTILKVCLAIIGRQREFLDRGIDSLRPMMIKEVAEEVGVHPSTVSRAVANKYVHTPQGVFELRYFFSEAVQGPAGESTSLLILKRKVKKLIEEEDRARPFTDDQITHILQSQGIMVTRRTVAKYREDMKIPSTHQRRIKS